MLLKWLVSGLPLVWLAQSYSMAIVRTALKGMAIFGGYFAAVSASLTLGYVFFPYYVQPVKGISMQVHSEICVLLKKYCRSSKMNFLTSSLSCHAGTKLCMHPRGKMFFVLFSKFRRACTSTMCTGTSSIVFVLSGATKLRQPGGSIASSGESCERIV